MLFYLFFFILGFMVALSVVSFGMYGWDKRQAKGGGDRISEKSLHVVSLLGGWPGAILGQKLFRHKTQKTSFRIVFFATVALHLLLCFSVLYFLWPF